MLLNDMQVSDILSEVLNRTWDRKLRWHQLDDKLLSELPNQVTVELSKNSDSDSIQLQLKTRSGTVLGESSTDKSEASPAFLLYQAASEMAGESLFSEIIEGLRLTNTTTKNEESAQQRVTDLERDEVLQKMSGKWILDYSYGKEQVWIQPNGDYYIATRAEPVFHLKVLAWNKDRNATEVAKDMADGRRRQIEFLSISQDVMVGHAKHDGHRLLYKRV